MQIMFEARNQQILFNKDAEIFYYKDLESGDIMYIPPVLQEFLNINRIASRIKHVYNKMFGVNNETKD